MSLPPLPDLCTWGKTVLTREDMIQVRMREYGALCRKQALEEAAKFCESQQVNHSPRGTKMFLPFDSECMGTHEGIYYAKAIRELK
jgi:hypothetical protein